jgi:hypothetical protein
LNGYIELRDALMQGLREEGLNVWLGWETRASRPSTYTAIRVSLSGFLSHVQLEFDPKLATAWFISGDDEWPLADPQLFKKMAAVVKRHFQRLNGRELPVTDGSQQNRS